MTPRDRTERLQGLARGIIAHVDALRLSDDLDQCLYEAVRESLMAGGATDTEIDRRAALFIIWATEHTAPGSAERESQYDPITTPRVYEGPHHVESGGYAARDGIS